MKRKSERLNWQPIKEKNSIPLKGDLKGNKKVTKPTKILIP